MSVNAQLPSSAYDTKQHSREQLPGGTYGDFVANGSCGFTLKIDATRCPSMVRVDGKSPQSFGFDRHLSERTSSYGGQSKNGAGEMD